MLPFFLLLMSQQLHKLHSMITMDSGKSTANLIEKQKQSTLRMPSYYTLHTPLTSWKWNRQNKFVVRKNSIRKRRVSCASQRGKNRQRLKQRSAHIKISKRRGAELKRHRATRRESSEHNALFVLNLNFMPVPFAAHIHFVAKWNRCVLRVLTCCVCVRVCVAA